MTVAGMDVWRAVDAAVVAPAAASGVDAWASVAARVDVVGWRPALGSWVEVNTIEARGGRGAVMAANRRDLVYYRLEPSEAALLSLMDGSRTVGEIVVAQLSADGRLDVAAVVELVQVLHAGGFLTAPYTDVDAAVVRAVAPKGISARLSRVARTMSVEWSGAERLTVWLHEHGLRVLFTRWGAWVAGLVAGLGAVAFVAVGVEHGFTYEAQSVGLAFAMLFVLDMVLIFIHELGHAALLVHYGRRVRSSGVRIYFGTPAFFIDSSDALMLTRGQRILQSFAGPYFELVATGAAALVLWGWPHGPAADFLYPFVVLNYFVLLLNLIPLLELDGYWILSDAIRVPDLRPRSLTFMRHDLWAKLAHRQRFTAAEFGLGLYGTIGVLFTIFCLVTSVLFWQRTFGGLVTDLWEAGPAGVAALAVLAAFVTGPLVRGLSELIRAVVRRIRTIVRNVRFRTEAGWRIEAAELLDRQPMFDDLPVEVLNDIAGRVTLVSVSTARAVVRQGERAAAYFLVRSGTLEVVETDPDTNDERVVHTLSAGESFGEFGLATGAPRNATVRAVTRGELFRIDKATFDRLLADRIRLPTTGPTLQTLVDLRALPPFRNLRTEDLAALDIHGAWQTVAPATTIIREGEPGDAFYVIAAGQAAVVHDDTTLATLQPGDYFGETALLTDGPRTATVTTLTPTRVFRLDAAGFHALVAGTVPPRTTTTPEVFTRE